MEENEDKRLIFYERHLERMRNYNKTHKEQIRERVKSTYYKMKEDPEKWEAFKAKKREYYLAKRKASEEKELNN